MSNVMFFDPRPQLLDDNANPLFRGKMEFYEVGSVIPKAVFADKELSVSLGNVIELDEAGRVPTSGLFLGVGDYSYSVFEDTTPQSPFPTWMETYNVPVVLGATQSTLGTNNAIFLNAIIDLPSVDFNESTVATCLGYYSAFDGGGGLFKWSPLATAPDDLGSVIASALSSTGRWIRIFDENVVTTAQFGVIGGINTNMITRIQNCATYSNGSGFRMIFTQGNIKCDGFFDVNAQNVTIAENFKLVRLNALSPTGMVLNANSIEVLGISHITQLGSTTIRLRPIQPLAIQPQWFGAVGNGISDDYLAISEALQSGSSLLLDGIFKVNGTGDLNIGDVEFKAGSSLIHNSSGVITIDGVVSTAFGYNSVFVKGSPTNRFNMIRDVNAEWFIGHSPTEFEMRFLVDSATNQGTRIANVIWSQVGVYNIPFCNDYDPFALTTHIIQPQSVWNLSGNTLQIGNGEVTPNMFENQDIQSAINLASRNNIWLNGLNQRQVLPANITTVGIYKTVKIRNLWLWGSYSFDLGDKGAIIRESFFEFVTITASANAWVVDIQNCEFQGGLVADWGVSATRMTIKNNVISAMNYVNTQPSKYGFFINNTIQDIGNQVSHNGVGDGNVLIQGNNYQNLNGEGVNPFGTNLPPYALILKTCSNLTFSNNAIEILRPADSTPTTGLSVASAVCVYGSVSNDWIADRLIIKDNTIAIENGDYHIYRMFTMKVQGFANIGHRALVIDNIAKSFNVAIDTIPSTWSEWSQGYSAPDSCVNVNVSLLNLCLPYDDFIKSVSHLASLISGEYYAGSNPWVKVNPLTHTGGGNCYCFIESAMCFSTASTGRIYANGSVNDLRIQNNFA